MSLTFKVFKPKPISLSVFRSAFIDAAEEMASDVHDDFDEITSEFRHAVHFDEDVTMRGSVLALTVLTDDLGFKYYDQGNGGPETIIRPRQAKALRWIDKDGEVIFRKSVHGYDGRHAVAKIQAAYAKKAPLYFERAMAEAVSKL